MFVTAVLLFLLKLKWPKNKGNDISSKISLDSLLHAEGQTHLKRSLNYMADSNITLSYFCTFLITKSLHKRF